MPPAEVVVLLGAPGSGKSTIGRLLGERGFRWREWERALVDRWGSREPFVAAKATALPELHEEMRSWVGQADEPAVVESTGLSDAAFLDALVQSRPCLVVRLDVSAAVAAARVAARPTGEHLADDEAGIARVDDAFRRVVLPARQADLAIDTESVTPVDAADAIADLWRTTDLSQP